MEARRQAELEARRQREAEHQRMLEEQKRRAEEQREMARSGSIHYPGSPRPSVSTFFLKLNMFPCVGFHQQIASFLVPSADLVDISLIYIVNVLLACLH